MIKVLQGGSASRVRLDDWRWLLLLLGLLVPACEGGSSASISTTTTETVTSGTIPTVPIEVTELVLSNAMTLETVEPDDGLSDLEPLRSLVGDARVVALGEASHGTHEFFTMKDRLVRFLVQELGFTDFAMESSLSDARLIDRYVRTGEGDPGAALDLGFTVWNTEEMLDLVEWMRSYNASVPANQAVGFWGFDMQNPQAAIDQVVSYVTGALPSEVDELEAEYRCFELLGGAGYGGVPEPTREQCRTGVDAASAWIDVNRDRLTEASSVDDYDWAARNARVVVQAEKVGSANDAEASNQLRDQFMAENAMWLLDQSGSDAKLILWAHNGHIARSSRGGRYRPMGAFLDADLSANLVVIGFEFSSGSLTTIRGTSRGLEAEVVTVPPPAADSYASAFASSGLGKFILDLRHLPDDPGARWLLDKHPVRWIGATYDPLNDADTVELASLPQMFDLVIYIEDTTPSNVRVTEP